MHHAPRSRQHGFLLCGDLSDLQRSSLEGIRRDPADSTRAILVAQPPLARERQIGEAGIAPLAGCIPATWGSELVLVHLHWVTTTVAKFKRKEPSQTVGAARPGSAFL